MKLHENVIIAMIMIGFIVVGYFLLEFVIRPFPVLIPGLTLLIPLIAFFLKGKIKNPHFWLGASLIGCIFSFVLNEKIEETIGDRFVDGFHIGWSVGYDGETDQLRPELGPKYATEEQYEIAEKIRWTVLGILAFSWYLTHRILIPKNTPVPYNTPTPWENEDVP